MPMQVLWRGHDVSDVEYLPKAEKDLDFLFSHQVMDDYVIHLL